MEVLTFLIKNDRYAINIALIDAIENRIPVTPVPKAKDYVIGLINIRGNVLPVIDIGMVLGINTIDNDFQKLVIANLESGRIALAVTDIDEVLNVDNNDIETINNAKNLSVINVDGDVITLLTKNYLFNL